MRYTLLILSLLHLLVAENSFGQTDLTRTKDAYDTVFSLPKSNLELRIRIFDLSTDDPDMNTAILMLTNKHGKVVFTDSLHMGRLDFSFEDYNGDGIQDLVLYRHMLASRSNMSYNLYLISANGQNLQKVKGFEDVLNPSFDPKRRLIKSSYLYGSYIGWSYFKIDRNGKLHKISRNYTERVG